VKVFVALLLMAAVVTVAAPAVPAAEARPRTTASRQVTTIRKLRQQLRRMKVKLALSAKQVRTLNGQVSQLQGTLAQMNATLGQTNATLAQTNATLAQTRADLTVSQAQAAALQAKLDAIPTPLAIAEEQVHREVGWVEYEDRFNGEIHSDGQLVSLSAMNYVVGHVSTGAYGYLEVFGGTLPTARPDSILGTQAGICGHAALSFAAIVRHFGYAVRSVQFYYSTPEGTPDSHIADEVFYDGAWHFFDPTFGVFWTDPSGQVMSITDVRANGGTEHKDHASFTNLIEDPWFAGNDTAFETDPATEVVLDEQPF